MIKPFLATGSGRPINILFVSLLIAASSKSYGLFVAAMTKTFAFEDPTPSHWTKNSVFILFEASCSSLDLLDIIESISSKKITLGDYTAARANKVFINFSPSPIHLDTSELALILKNVHWHYVATAFASIVFPLPGGP